MTEKRFKGYAEKTGQHFELIINDLLGEEYSLTDDFFKSKDVIFEIVDLLNVMNDSLLEQAKENHKLSNKLNEQQTTIKKQEEIIKSQDMEISRQYNLCLAMSGLLREEFGVYDVFDRSKDKRVK